MIRSRLAVLSLALLAGAAAADETLLRNGPSEDRLDLVFLGDGYAEGELDVYRADVDRFTEHLFSQPPFSTHKDLFNVHRVDLVSAESGADDACAGRSAATALDAGFYATGGDCRLLFTYSAAKVYQAAARAPGYDPGAGLVVVLVNSPRYGGAAVQGGYVVANRGPSGPETLAHEIGHSFGLLADEYVQAGKACPAGEPAQLNVTAEKDLGRLKWRAWVGPGAALPSLDELPGRPGLYEGGMNCGAGIFRPTFNSKMRALNNPYDPVNEALLTARMDALVPPTVDFPSPTISGGRVSVSASAWDGVKVSRLELLLDGKPSGAVVEGADEILRGDWIVDVGPGPHALSLRAVDGAGNATLRTVSVSVGGETSSGGTPAALRPPPVPRPAFLSPGVRDGMNDEAVFGDDAEEVTIYDASGRAVFSSTAGTSWNAENAESGVYVARVLRRDGTRYLKTLMVAR